MKLIVRLNSQAVAVAGHSHDLCPIGQGTSYTCGEVREQGREGRGEGGREGGREGEREGERD